MISRISNQYESFYLLLFICLLILKWFLDARGVMVIVVGNGHGDTSSNPYDSFAYDICIYI